MSKESELEKRLLKNIKENKQAEKTKIDKLVDDVNKAFKEHYESVNHPKHYNNYDVEVIDMMERIWGVENTINFCEMNAFKYRMRMGTKPEQSIEQDLKKEKWYLDKAKELKLKL